jgi:hypothetical protein
VDLHSLRYYNESQAAGKGSVFSSPLLPELKAPMAGAYGIFPRIYGLLAGMTEYMKEEISNEIPKQ